jgi:hypothetical protein
MISGNGRGHQILNASYIQACRALLSAHGLTVDVREDCASSKTHNKIIYMSLLGASGDGIRLWSILKMDQNLAIGTHPSGFANLARHELEDWCKEINNQIVGRLKNKLLGYGCIVIVGLPVLLTAADCNPPINPESEVHQYCVESADGQITLTLETHLAHDAELYEMESSTTDEEALTEGEVLLF